MAVTSARTRLPVDGSAHHLRGQRTCPAGDTERVGRHRFMVMLTLLYAIHLSSLRNCFPKDSSQGFSGGLLLTDLCLQRTHIRVYAKAYHPSLQLLSQAKESMSGLSNRVRLSEDDTEVLLKEVL